MSTPKPNVVRGDAAAVARAFVFEQRNAGGIDPHEVVARMLEAGHGTEFPPEVRKKRMKTWALQVLRRLRKRGWLDAPGAEGWPPTAALRGCSRARALAKQAPRGGPRPKGPRKPASRESAAKKPAAAMPDSRRSRPESWGDFVQDWVFRHRDSKFGVPEVAVAVVQGGYGTGDLGGRLDGARDIVEREFAALEKEGLIRLDRRSDLWKATDLLLNWPEG